MIVLFTDFGTLDPYIGQVRNVLAQQAASVTVIDLFNNAPKYNPEASAYLLAAYVNEFPPGTVFLGVVDPGVGAITRRALALCVDGRWFVGPDNGLFNMVLLQAKQKESLQCWEIIWRPENSSSTFHGRDIFAPSAAKIALGDTHPGEPIGIDKVIKSHWPKNLNSIIYIDHFGNAISGIQASSVNSNTVLTVNKETIYYARTYSDLPLGKAFWYPNANSLVEVAINQGNASEHFGLDIGTEVSISN